MAMAKNQSRIMKPKPKPKHKDRAKSKPEYVAW